MQTETGNIFLSNGHIFSRARRFLWGAELIQMLASIEPQIFRLAKLLTNKNCMFCLTLGALQFLMIQSEEGLWCPWRRISASKVHSSLMKHDETRALCSRTSFNSTVFLKIVLIPQDEHLNGSFLPCWGSAMLGKPDPDIQVQKGETEGMIMCEGAVRFLSYQIIPFLSSFSNSWDCCLENVAGSIASV